MQRVQLSARRQLECLRQRIGMPAHFSRFIADSQSAGLLIVSQSIAIREAIEEILLVWAASETHEWHNRIAFLPI